MANYEKPGTLEEALAAFHGAADAMVSNAQKSINSGSISVTAPYWRATGDLAVTGLEELAKATADYRRAEEARAQAASEVTKQVADSARATTNLTRVIAWATAVYAAATVVFYIFQWRHPPATPVVNVAGPTINLPPQAIQHGKPGLP